jgi:hypothetical protein
VLAIRHDPVKVTNLAAITAIAWAIAFHQRFGRILLKKKWAMGRRVETLAASYWTEEMTGWITT